jgi:hypothetical protein
VQKFIKAVEEAKLDQELRDSIKAMGEPDTMTAHALAKSAAEKMAKLIGQCNGLPQNGKQCLTARFKPKISNALGNTMEQIMAAMGMGSGQGGRDGYSLFNDDVALYGPNVELAGEQAGGRSDSAASAGQRSQRVGSDAKDPGLKTVEATGRVRLQPDAKFPLRYRELVGEYFKAIAETQDK